MSELVIYQPEAGEAVAVRLEGDTLWLKQEQMAELFGRERSVITKHLKNVFKDGELIEESNVQYLHIAGSDKPVKFYNPDAIISVGYRVNSERGTLFRQWATGVLRGHLTQGWTLDRARMERNAAEFGSCSDVGQENRPSPRANCRHRTRVGGNRQPVTSVAAPFCS